MKLSALPDRRNYPHRDITPNIRALVDAFTPRRLMYGLGFDNQATGESYRAYREQVRSHLTRLSEADQALVLGGNAVKLFGLES